MFKIIVTVLVCLASIIYTVKAHTNQYIQDSSVSAIIKEMDDSNAFEMSYTVAWPAPYLSYISV